MADHRDGAATTYSLRSLGTGALQAAAGNHTHGAGSGDFVGPGASTDHAVVRFDLATGKLGQNSVLVVSDLGVCTGGEWSGTYTDANLAAIDAGTWTGMTTITTVGTISTGVWSGTRLLAAKAPILSDIEAPTASVSFAQQQATSFVIENRTSDPGSPVAGQIWLRTDL